MPFVTILNICEPLFSTVKRGRYGFRDCQLFIISIDLLLSKSKMLPNRTWGRCSSADGSPVFFLGIGLNGPCFWILLLLPGLIISQINSSVCWADIIQFRAAQRGKGCRRGEDWQLAVGNFVLKHYLRDRIVSIQADRHDDLKIENISV